MKFESNNMHSSSYFAPGVVIAYGKSIDARPHKHSLWQLCLPSEESLLSDERLLTGQVIPPNELHQLSTLPTGLAFLTLALPLA